MEIVSFDFEPLQILGKLCFTLTPERLVRFWWNLETMFNTKKICSFGFWDPYLLIFNVPPKFIKPNQKCKAEYRVGRRVITLGSMRFEFVASTFVSLHMLNVLWTMSYSSTLFLAWSWIYMLCYIVCLMADLTTRVRHCQGFSLTFDLHRS